MNCTAYDVVFVERAITRDAYAILENCKMHGVRTWIDYDDNLFQIPDYNKSQDYFARQQVVQLVQGIMQMADVVTVATPHLLKLYRGLNPNTHIIPNAWNDYTHNPLPEVTAASTPARIAWRGGDKHIGDLYEARNAVARTLSDAAFEWQFLGDRPHFLNVKRKQYRPFSRLGVYFQQFFTAGLDYLFVPLVVNNFNRAKSNCSWIEATIGGAPTIAPAGLPEFNQPGVILYKDTKYLVTIFEGIKKGKYDKRERVEASREALQDYRLSKLNFIRKEIVENLIGRTNTEEQ